MSLELSQTDFFKLIELLELPETESLFALAAKSSLNREELLSQRLPLGISVIEAESFIAAVCRLFSIRYPIINDDGIEYWFYPTTKIISLLQSISLRSSNESSLAKVRKSEYQPRLDKNALHRTTDRLCQLAGVHIDDNRGKKLVSGDDEISDDADRLYMNAYNLLKDVPELASKEDFYSVGTLDGIYSDLVEGLSNAEELRQRNIDNKDPKMKEKLAAILRVGTSGWSKVGSLVETILLRWSLQYIAPYGKLTLMAADIYARQHLMRDGYQMLRFTPFFTTHIPGSRGLRNDAEAETMLPILAGDLTPILERILEEINTALDEQLATYEEIIRREETVRSLLRSDLSLNHRQRSILERALRYPDVTFSISYHRARHDITYSTARKDLFNLMELGYLDVKKDQKAYVFFAAEDLQRKLEQRHFPSKETPGSRLG